MDLSLVDGYRAVGDADERLRDWDRWTSRAVERSKGKRGKRKEEGVLFVAAVVFVVVLLHC
jgi:hypothetical protein